jgi:hypothetical protein
MVSAASRSPTGTATGVSRYVAGRCPETNAKNASGSASGPVESSVPPSDVAARPANEPDSTATSQPAGKRTVAELPPTPFDANAHTGIVTSPLPTRTCGFAPLPVAGRVKVSR